MGTIPVGSFLQYGAVGAMLLVLCLGIAWFVRWAATTLGPRVIKHFDKIEAVMDSTVARIGEMGDAARAQAKATQDLVTQTQQARHEQETGRIQAIAELRAEIAAHGAGNGNLTPLVTRLGGVEEKLTVLVAELRAGRTRSRRGRS